MRMFVLALLLATVACGGNPAAPSPPPCHTVPTYPTPVIVCHFGGCELVDPGPVVLKEVCP